MNSETKIADTPGELAHFIQAAQDSVTDDMVARLVESSAQALDLLDRLNRSGIDRALPVVARLVENGDLDRVANYARLLAAAEDSLTDDMVGRIAEMGAEALMVVDRLNRSGVSKLVDILDKLNQSGALDRLSVALPKLLQHIDLIERLSACVGLAADDVRQAPKSTGGLFSLLRIVSAPENQAFIQFALALGRRVNEACETKE